MESAFKLGSLILVDIKPISFAIRLKLQDDIVSR